MSKFDWLGNTMFRCIRKSNSYNA